MTERRADTRRRVCLGGLIEAAAFMPAIPCLVRDVSLTGARVRIDAGTILPEILILSVPSRAEQRRARLIWRERDQAGFRFEEGERPPQEASAGAAWPPAPSGTLH